MDQVSPSAGDSESNSTDDASAAALRRAFEHYFRYTLGRDRLSEPDRYVYLALALTLRDRLTDGMNRTRHACETSRARRVYYLSMEYLIGRSLHNAVLNMDLEAPLRDALCQMGLELEEIEQAEHDAGLGNGGLGRLAACFLDSCATLALPVVGYGIRYRYGMFRQRISNGCQIEEPDHWLRDGHPWEFERPEAQQHIQFEGRSEFYEDDSGRTRARWIDSHDVVAVPHDVPVPGYGSGIVNILRLWSAEATDAFNLDEFNAGSYPEAVRAKNAAENITMVLYPNDSSENGKELRLRQQYFLAAASLKDVMRQWTRVYGEDFSEFSAKHCFQLNDTHPSIAVPELMRLLMDEHGLDWDAAWAITTSSIAYTNHTLLPEALERWPVRLFAELLPRHIQIIEEINGRFLARVARQWPGDLERLRRMSIIEEGDTPMVRMAYLAVAAAFSVNGVAAIHSRLIESGLFRDFSEFEPKKFNNKTNGVTPRRWLMACNPRLAELIDRTIGEHWRSDLGQLSQLEQHRNNAPFLESWDQIKRDNKQRLTDLVQSECGVALDVGSMFDVQVKRIHEYKRQLLNVLHVIHLYCRIKNGHTASMAPRSVIIGGKAAPGYEMAKSIIKLVNNVAAQVNEDPDTEGLLRLVFLPDYRVSSMEVICPAADLSAQLSTAGKEASGTGNMKFMMNGAVTIGTLDGANIEILEAVGDEHFFQFGLDAQAVARQRGSYDPAEIVNTVPAIGEVVGLLTSGYFSQFEPGLFDPIVNAMLDPADPWMTIADMESFFAAQARANDSYLDRAHWLEMSVTNTAMSGRFSSDRTIGDYNDDIWGLEPIRLDQIKNRRVA